MVNGIEKFLEDCKRLNEQATIGYYLKPKKQYHRAKSEPYTKLEYAT